VSRDEVGSVGAAAPCVADLEAGEMLPHPVEGLLDGVLFIDGAEPVRHMRSTDCQPTGVGRCDVAAPAIEQRVERGAIRSEVDLDFPLWQRRLHRLSVTLGLARPDERLAVTVVDVAAVLIFAEVQASAILVVMVASVVTGLALFFASIHVSAPIHARESKWRWPMPMGAGVELVGAGRAARAVGTLEGRAGFAHGVEDPG
jgi:hypothetical protein